MDNQNKHIDYDYTPEIVGFYTTEHGPAPVLKVGRRHDGGSLVYIDTRWPMTRNLKALGQIDAAGRINPADMSRFTAASK